MSTESTTDSARSSEPIQILETQASKLCSYIVPSFLLTTFVSRFGKIVEDPASSLSTLLLQLAIAQGLYLVLCLPPVARSVDQSNAKAVLKSKKTTGSSSSVKAADVGSRVTTAILSLALALLAGTPLITGIMILFGAPLTTNLPETILCAAHLAFLAVPQLVYTYGVDSENWRRIGALMTPIDAVYGTSLGAVVGAWLGAIPIPLDWDREWQRWPCTIIAGAYGGWAVGGLVGRYILRGKTVDLST